MQCPFLSTSVKSVRTISRHWYTAMKKPPAPSAIVRSLLLNSQCSLFPRNLVLPGRPPNRVEIAVIRVARVPVPGRISTNSKACSGSPLSHSSTHAVITRVSFQKCCLRSKSSQVLRGLHGSTPKRQGSRSVAGKCLGGGRIRAGFFLACHGHKPELERRGRARGAAAHAHRGPSRSSHGRQQRPVSSDLDRRHVGNGPRTNRREFVPARLANRAVRAARRQLLIPIASYCHPRSPRHPSTAPVD